MRRPPRPAVSRSLSRSPSTRSAWPRLLCVTATSIGDSCSRVFLQRGAIVIDRLAQRRGIAGAFALQRQHRAAVALHARPVGGRGLARIDAGRQAIAVERRVQPGRIAVALAQHDLRRAEQRHRARPVLRRAVRPIHLQRMIARGHRRMQHHRIVDARAQRPQRGGKAALRLRPVERRLCARRQLQCGIEARDRIGDARDVFRRLALGQQQLGLGDRLTPGFVGLISRRASPRRSPSRPAAIRGSAAHRHSR